MKQGKLIGIVGYAGSGKTTITRAAIDVPHMADVKQMSFSTPIVQMLRAIGVPSELLNDKSRWNEPLEMLCGHSIRYAATTLGTEWGRDLVGQELWTRIGLAQAARHRAIGRHVIIDAVRFPSEMEAMREAGAVFVAMYRADVENVAKSTDNYHESERHIFKLRQQCEWSIENSGTFNDAVARMRKIIVDIIDA
jgi:ABC-type dipeptide/oligopeptide/nickel transport system ATPase component